MSVTASGDLYLHQTGIAWPGSISTARSLRPTEPNPSLGIPIFAIKNYRYYVRVTKILEGTTLGKSFTLGFELHRFDHTSEVAGRRPVHRGDDVDGRSTGIRRRATTSPAP